MFFFWFYKLTMLFSFESLLKTVTINITSVQSQHAFRLFLICISTVHVVQTIILLSYDADRIFDKLSPRRLGYRKQNLIKNLGAF